MKLVTIARAGGDAPDLSGLLRAAPGVAGDPTTLGGRDWSAFEASIDASKRAELDPYLKTHLSAAPVDFAIVDSVNRKKRLLLCDMDSTIIGQECLDELADFAGKKSEVSAITERAMRGELDFEGALTERVAMLSGLELSALEDCYRLRISLNSGAQTLVSTMKAAGARCVLVSGGFTFFTGRVAEAAGFHADRANTLLDDGTALTGEVLQPILGREAKLDALIAEAAALGLNPSDALAIGDGANDLAMIEAAGFGLAYRAKPVVADKADASINHVDLTAALFYQGYHEDDFVLE